MINELRAKLAATNDTFTLAQFDAAVAELMAPAAVNEIENFVETLTKGAVDPTKGVETALDTASEHEEPEAPVSSHESSDETFDADAE